MSSSLFLDLKDDLSARVTPLMKAIAHAVDDFFGFVIGARGSHFIE
jgi:hypothetical protein